MEKQKIFIIIPLAVLVLAIAGILSYYLLSSRTTSNQIANIPGNLRNVPNAKVNVPTQEELAAQNKIKYPNTVIGIINFLDKGVIIKTTVKTSDGILYTLSPNQPKVIYESFGVKNGNRVQIQGKIQSDNTLTWLTMKAI